MNSIKKALKFGFVTLVTAAMTISFNPNILNVSYQVQQIEHIVSSTKVNIYNTTDKLIKETLMLAYINSKRRQNNYI
ncbi:hypothetical protein AN642_02785 [Epulopiscium sp. SCG-B10WGA-EpuloA2]|nr:hypothetical protein AN642_02785 [Epulopiscium sp. SCG-B10WGA-EpuloA2]